MRFSVIIPTYNEESFIEQCLLSVSQQLFDKQDYEIIVSDGGSSDKTIEIAKRYTSKVISINKRGIALGRNEGAKIAQGDIFVFFDADTIVHPTFLELCNNSFIQEEVIGFTGIAVPYDGNIVARIIYHATYYLMRLLFLFRLILFPGICVAYSREAFNNVAGFREDFGIVEDLDLSRRISKLGKCVVNKKAKVGVSTRRLHDHLFSTVVFHIVSDIRYLVTGKTVSVYPKKEEIHSSKDLWKRLYEK